MKAKNFFSEAENRQITAAIAEVEAKTSGEIAVMISDRSDSYPEGNILAGIILGGLLALLTADLVFASSLHIFLMLFAGLTLLLGWLVSYIPAVKRAFIPRARLEAQVREQALQSFYNKGLHKTSDATGVLFFVSLFEHKVWVLADKGIYEKITSAALQSYARDMAASIKQGGAAETVCREIRELGEALARHFPRKADDVNELPDQVIIDQTEEQ